MGRDSNSEQPQHVPTSLCSRCRQSSSVSSISLSAKVNTHILSQKAQSRSGPEGVSATVTSVTPNMPGLASG